MTMKRYVAIISDCHNSSVDLATDYKLHGASNGISAYPFEAPNDEIASLMGRGLFFENDWSNDGTVSAIIAG